jgi:hypothetical protein
MDQKDFEKAAEAWRAWARTRTSASSRAWARPRPSSSGRTRQGRGNTQRHQEGRRRGIRSAISANLAFAAEKAGQTDLAISEYEALKSKDSGNEAFLDYKIGTLKPKS